MGIYCIVVSYLRRLSILLMICRCRVKRAYIELGYWHQQAECNSSPGSFFYQEDEILTRKVVFDFLPQRLSFSHVSALIYS